MTEVRPAALSEAQRLAGLRLIRSEGVGPATFHELLRHFGSAEQALEALPDLSRRGGRRTIRVCPAIDAERELDWLARHDAHLVALGENGYPASLAHVDAPPPFLCVSASPTALKDTLSRPMVAIVGSRNCSIAGRKLAARFASGLGADDFVVVSGLARGIDGAAHEASLSTGTVAVMASGLDRIYPPEHEDLARRIVAEGGALVSEMPVGWEPRAHGFPRRNRLISGMALGVVVVEAAKRSGSLHTARFAAEQGREVFAIPGSPLDPRSDGCNKLIRDGATLAAEPRHVLDAVKPLVGRAGTPTLFMREDGEDAPPTAPPADADEAVRAFVIDALGPAPVAVDDLIRHGGLTPQVVQLVLLELDLAGRIERHPGGLVSLVPSDDDC